MTSSAQEVCPHQHRVVPATNSAGYLVNTLNKTCTPISNEPCLAPENNLGMLESYQINAVDEVTQSGMRHHSWTTRLMIDEHILRTVSHHKQP